MNYTLYSLERYRRSNLLKETNFILSKLNYSKSGHPSFSAGPHVQKTMYAISRM